MHKLVALFLLVFASSLLAQASPEYKIEKLTDGVYALIRQDPVGWMVVSNCVFIVNDEDVVVVDTGGAMSLARQMIADLKKITNNMRHLKSHLKMDRQFIADDNGNVSDGLRHCLCRRDRHGMLRSNLADIQG